MSVVISWVVPLLGCFMGIARHTIATREVLAVRSGQRLGVRHAALYLEWHCQGAPLQSPKSLCAAGPQPTAVRSHNSQLLWMGCVYNLDPQLVCLLHGCAWPPLQHMDDILSISLRLT